LRREGLYQSHIHKWRSARDRGGLVPKPAKSESRKNDPGKAAPVSAGVESAETRRLRAENKKLVAELEKTRAVVEILGKTHALLEMLSESADLPTKPTV
jgi:transposase